MKNTYLLFTLLFLVYCKTKDNPNNNPTAKMDLSGMDTATFAGGCFWCVEASFEQIAGVAEGVSGYAGGDKNNANYKLVSAGKTKHAETVQVYYDPEVISYESLLDIFFTAHDPTQVNRQGPDVGYQYRSVIFYHRADQRTLAEGKIQEIKSQYDDPIATVIHPYEAFYPAEDYHQDYAKKHPFDPYILNVSRPKIDKVKKKFEELLKEK